jgi:hypothetical protein
MDPFNGKETGASNLICGLKNLREKSIFKMREMALFGLPMKSLNNTFPKFKFANTIVASIFPTLLLSWS